MNERSSRSHAIFITTIECCETMGSENHIRVGKLNMVDLAGSERQSKTNASGERLVDLEGLERQSKTNASGERLVDLVGSVRQSKTNASGEKSVD